MTRDEIYTFVTSLFSKVKKWKLGNDNFFHFVPEVKKSTEPIPSIELAEQAIEYARELEMIV